MKMLEDKNKLSQMGRAEGPESRSSSEPHCPKDFKEGNVFNSIIGVTIGRMRNTRTEKVVKKRNAIKKYLKTFHKAFHKQKRAIKQNKK